MLGARPGDVLVVGELDGRLGTGTVRAIDAAGLELQVVLQRDPPPPLPVALALALPRPPTLRKVLQQATALGVKQLLLFGSARVEKSFWQSSLLRPGALDEQLRLGLEQARDTVRPHVTCERSFARFADALPERPRAGAALWLAEAGAPPPPAPGASGAVLVLGPEGGLLPAEVERLRAAGAQPVGAGARPLRVETAAVALLGAIAARCGPPAG